MPELDYTKRVSITNNTNIDCYYHGIERDVDVKVPKKSKILQTIGEIMAQCNASNPDFVGIDRSGNHATFYIEDRDVRIEAGFESADGKTTQEIVDEDAIIKLFEIAKLDQFVKALQTKVVTIGEKQTLREILGSGKVNEHDKITIAEKYLSGDLINIPKNSPGRTKKTE